MTTQQVLRQELARLAKARDIRALRAKLAVSNDWRAVQMIRLAIRCATALGN